MTPQNRIIISASLLALAGTILERASWLSE
jgi:hypothetical protein